MIRIRKICLAFLLICMNMIHAQQDPQYTQYMHNTASINPAYIGSLENLSVVGLVRNQWIGLEGAPKTQTLSFSAPIDYYKRMGLGFSITNDAIGITNESYFNIDYSYNIPFGNYSTLSFGLKAVGHLLSVDYQKLSIFDINETDFLGSINNKFNPNVGVGIYYNTEKFYLGLSVPYLFDTKFYDKTTNLEDITADTFLRKERIHFYWMGGYVFDINEEVRFKPAVLTKLVVGAPLQVDLSGNFLFHDNFAVGLAYRWSAAVSAMSSVRISDKFIIGFAYDWETTELGNTKFNDGSLEVVLKFHLPEGYRGRRRFIPRFF